MLVYVRQGFAETWPCKEKVKDGFRKYHFEELTEYCKTGVSFICDEKDIEKEVVRHIEDYIKDNRRVVGYSFEIPAGRYPDDESCANGYQFKRYVDYVKDMKMSKILDLLTGEQFAQFCKEMGIGAEAIANG